MTATISPSAVPTSAPTYGESTSTQSTPSLWKAGVVAGLGAAAATVGVAAVAHAAGVSFESAPGEAIPVAGFAQLTLFFTAVGVVIAAAMRRRSAQPRSLFVKTAVVLTVLSVVPDLAVSFDLASKLTLMLTHVVAAAIVIPSLSARLPERRSR